jgi:tetratricopeptide (TPR) repeat protein
VAYGCLVAISFFVVIELVLAFGQVEQLSTNKDPFVGFESTLPLYIDESGARDLKTTASNRLRYFHEQTFSAEKKAGTYRIICLGGSTTYGRPYGDGTSFPGWLRELLPLADSDRKYEVINAGGISYASYRIAHLMDELCTYEPDLFIVYTGHNEFLEERQYREFKTSTMVPPKVQWALGHSRSYSSLRSLYERSRGSRTVDSRSILPSEVDTILDRSVGPTSYRRDKLQRSAVVGHLAFNLARIIESARRADADIMFVKPGFNLKDFSPFKSEPTADMSPSQIEGWETARHLGLRNRAAGNLEAAAVALERSAQIDPQNAQSHYDLGTTLLELGRFQTASKHLQLAVDEDVCPLRATSAIQEVIEATAVLRRVPLIDFPAILATANEESLGHQVLGHEWFLDHVHPTPTANRLLAFAIVEALRQKGTLPKTNTQWSGPGIAYVIARVEESLDADQNSLALRNLSQVMGWAGKRNEAGTIALEAVAMRELAGLPDDPEALYYAAEYRVTMGDHVQAIRLLTRLFKLKPKLDAARRRLAYAQAMAGNHAEAAEQFRQLPSDVKLTTDEKRLFAVSLIEVQDSARAIEVLKTTKQEERNHDVHLVWARALVGEGENRQAALAYQRAIGEKPDSIVARLGLARLFVSQNQPDKAKKLFTEVLELEPGMDEVRRELAALE